MANRKVPFGYTFSAGKIVVDDEAAKLVRRVFDERIDGITGPQIGARLYAERIPYFSENEKKAIDKVYCILRDDRYFGNDEYPPVISEETFIQAKSSMVVKTFGKPIDTYTLLKKMSYCTECGRNMVHFSNGIGIPKWHCTTKGCANFMPVITEIEYVSQVQDILNTVINNPDLLDTEEPMTTYAPDNEVNYRNSMIAELLSQQPIDADKIKSEIIALTAVKYDCCTYSRVLYITQDLKAVVSKYKPSNEINTEMLTRTTDRITVDSNKNIAIVFKNGKTISHKGE